MTTADIIRHRLLNQQIAETKFKKPLEIVAWLCAMQAQEYSMAKWSIGLRLNGIKDADVERDFNEGKILRTHLMRPTWHFVTPSDIRWMLALTAPRVNVANAFMYRKCELDHAIFKRSNDTIVKTLEGGKHLTREKLKSALEHAKIFADGFRLSYIMMRAELDGIICSGARQGKQFTYALLDERVPVKNKKSFDREEALTELTKRYFRSRGPATIQDFATWSGLTMKEVIGGVATLKDDFIQETIDGKNYVFTPSAIQKSISKLQTTFLMPDYDEYGIGYKDRSAIFNKNINLTDFRGGNPVYNRMIIVDGQIAGTWQRTLKNDSVVVELVPFTSLSKSKNHAVIKAVKRFSSFVGKVLEV